MEVEQSKRRRGGRGVDEADLFELRIYLLFFLALTKVVHLKDTTNVTFEALFWL
jgi:hypothetical protein